MTINQFLVVLLHLENGDSEQVAAKTIHQDFAVYS